MEFTLNGALIIVLEVPAYSIMIIKNINIFIIFILTGATTYIVNFHMRGLVKVNCT